MSGDEPKSLGKPVDFDELYPGRFMKAGEFKGARVTVTITKVEVFELEGDKGKQAKGVITFKETTKELCLNRTNGECIKAMFGRKIEPWLGKRITLYPGTVESGSKKGEPAVRVWGSPDIAHDLDVSIQLPKRRPFSVTMHRIGTGAKPAEPSRPPASREPGDD